MNETNCYPWYFASGAGDPLSCCASFRVTMGIAYSFTDWNNFSDEINFCPLPTNKRSFGAIQYLKYQQHRAVHGCYHTV